MNDLVLALEGQVELLGLIFGKREKKKPDANLPPARKSASLMHRLRDMFSRHNQAWKGGKDGGG